MHRGGRCSTDKVDAALAERKLLEVHTSRAGHATAAGRGRGLEAVKPSKGGQQLGCEQAAGPELTKLLK